METKKIPGRIRFRNPELYQNKLLCRYIDIYGSSLYGVKQCSVNHATASILLIYDSKKTEYKKLVTIIEKAIRAAKSQKTDILKKYDEYFRLDDKKNKAKRSFLLFGIIYIILKIKHSLYGKFSISQNLRVLQMASLVTIVGGYPLLKRIYRRFGKYMPTDTDILLKLTAISFTMMRESSKGVMVLAFKALNDYVKYSADASSHKLLNQNMFETSGMAWVICQDSMEILTPVELLKAGDLIRIHPGEQIPANGTIEKGFGIVNTLYFSGQPVTMRVHNGSKVHEGMALIKGDIDVNVTEQATQILKGDIDAKNLTLYKKVTDYQESLAPISIAVSVLSYIITGNVLTAFSVLLVLCPSASGIAFSSGIKSHVALLNKHGIYLRNPNTIENTANIKTIVFDKTGTLTYSNLKLCDIKIFNESYSKNEILSICTACEADSYHPYIRQFS